MTLKQFLDFVEIRTKVASMLPFLAGVLYAVSKFHRFNALNTLWMFLSLLCIDLATTAITTKIISATTYGRVTILRTTPSKNTG